MSREKPSPSDLQSATSPEGRGKYDFDGENDELFLCKPCAESMKKGFRTVEDVKYIKPGREKGTCELCQRRRFGYYCEVEFREVESSEY